MTKKPPSSFKIDAHGRANPAAECRPTPQTRITVLASSIIRLEYAPHGRFTDAPTQRIRHRRHPVPSFTVTHENDTLSIITEHLKLTYNSHETRRFTADNTRITLLPDGEIWHPGRADDANLSGTARTLDDASGAIPLQPGLLSRHGWTVIDDSHTVTLTADGWIAPRETEPEAQDLYFIAYGDDYAAGLRRFADLSGRPPLIPRYMLGNWWSRFWRYDETELRDQMTQFMSQNLPFSVCVIDMDWHRTDADPYHSGWTGYSWNRDLFPDPAGFLAWLHQHDLQVTLNLHPADGIAPHEDAYRPLAQALGRDPNAEEVIPFDMTDPDFVNAYFLYLHHPLEEMGVDFWWIDWQQGRETAVPGLDPLWMLNHLHFLDSGRPRKGQKHAPRPIIFSRWSGLGSHRYPVGFSGDTYTDWPSLAFQPHFTATAANTGFGWWSHDIGGHSRGTVNGDLYARWVQFGALSPILRLHAVKNKYSVRRPHDFEPAVRDAAAAALRFRHALIPYIYTMARQDHDHARPLVRPLYHQYADHEEAYHAPGQYLFGTELMAAPYTTPQQTDTGFSRQAVWFPPGDWYDFFSGEYLPGGRWRAVYGRMGHLPLYAEAGAIVPLDGRPANRTDNPTELTLHLFTGADGAFDLYEDDGRTIAYQNDDYAVTRIRQTGSPQQITVTVDTHGRLTPHIPADRTITLLLHGVDASAQLNLLVDETPHPIAARYDTHTETLRLSAVPMAPTGRLHLTVTADKGRLLSRRDRRRERLQDFLTHFQMDVQGKQMIEEELDELWAEPARLSRFLPALTANQQRALAETLFSAGVHAVQYGHGRPTQLVAWNNDERPDIRLHHAAFNPGGWRDSRFHGRNEIAPRFAAWTQPHEQENDFGRRFPIRWQTILQYGHAFIVRMDSEQVAAESGHTAS